NRERELRRGQESAAVGWQSVRMNAVCHVNADGVVSEIFRREVQHRVRQAWIVVFTIVLEPANVVRNDDREPPEAGETLFQVLAMALDARPQRPQVHAVRPDANRPATAAGAERQDLIEAIQQPRPLPLLYQPFDLRPIAGELRLGEPLLEVFERLFLESSVCIDTSKPFGDRGQQIHDATSSAQPIAERRADWSRNRSA